MNINFRIEDLSIEEKIGQMLMVGIEQNKITQRTKDLILKYKIGGIILYKKNFNTYKEMINLIKELKDLNKSNKIPLFISIDQEGGRVNRMPKDILNLPSANKIASKMGKKGIEESSSILAEILSKSGFNMNLAPVLDLERFKKNTVIGDRSFGKNKIEVANYGIIQQNIFQDNGIVPVAKHFPGHGATEQDSHFNLPTIKLDIKTLENEDMYPFQEVIKEGIDGILIGHLRIKNITKHTPCSLSRKFIIRYLRRKFHYKGLIISDDLKMRAIKNRYGTVNALIKAIESGNDIIIFRYNQKQEKKSIEKILALAKNKNINIYKINKSVERILKVKDKYNIGNEIPIEEQNLEELNSRIQRIRNEVL